MARQGSPPGASDAALTALFAPRSVVVVGASDDPAKWGNILGRRALESGTERVVALVNRAGTQVLGRPAYRSLAEVTQALGEPVDLVVLCVPARTFLATVEEAVDAGVRAVVAITAGLSELGAEGADIEARAVALVRSAGAVLVGPNCLGVVDTGSALQLSHAVLPPGEVAVFSQSGNLVLDLAALLAQRDLGISRFVSVGNQADLTVVDLMRACLGHDRTRAVAIYAEDVVDGRGFVAAAQALGACGKPVVLLSPGRSTAAVRSAISHTGSMTSPAQVVDAACTASGVLRVDHPVQMADVLEALLGQRRMAGRSVAVLTDGGGHGAVAADALAATGLDVPVLGEATRQLLSARLWASSSVANPVDLAGAGDRDPTSYAAAVEALLVGDDVDGVLVTGYFGGYSTAPGPLGDLETAAAQRIADAARSQAKPVVVHTIFPSGPSAAVLRSAGVPVHRDVDRAATVLCALAPRSTTPVDDLPLTAPAVSDTSYAAARALFAGAGVPFPVTQVVRGRGELAAAAAETGFPLVLKALGSEHKSDAGGVVLGLADQAAAEAAYDELVNRLAPPAVSVESMVELTAGVEILVGCVRDRTFGAVVVVGLGGIHTEVLGDSARALAPIGVDLARELLLSLRGAPLLTGIRGSVPVDLEALAAVVSTVSRVAAEHPELAEIELNPVLAGRGGVVALDARIVLAEPPSTDRR